MKLDDLGVAPFQESPTLGGAPVRERVQLVYKYYNWG